MKSQKPTREIAIAIHKKYLKDCDADVVDYMEECVKQGQLSERKRILNLIDGRKIECTMKFGEWWMKLNELTKQIQGVHSSQIQNSCDGESGSRISSSSLKTQEDKTANTNNRGSEDKT